MTKFATLEPLNAPGPITSATPYILCNEQGQAETLTTLISLIGTETKPAVNSTSDKTEFQLEEVNPGVYETKATLSESEEKVFLNSGETNKQNLTSDESSFLSEKSELGPPPSEPLAKPHDTVHIGFSIWFNLDLISITKPDYAIILDIDSKVYGIYELIQSAFLMSQTPQEFIKNLFDELQDNPGLLPTTLEHLERLFQEQLNRNYGFLSSQESYTAVKTMVENGNIFFGSGDLTDKRQMDLIEKWCVENNVTKQTLYLSNIPEWICEHSPSKVPTFLSNLKTLISPATAVIHAAYPTQHRTGSGPPQHVTVGNIPSFEKKKVKKMQPTLNLERSSKQGKNLFGSPDIEQGHNTFLSTTTSTFAFYSDDKNKTKNPSTPPANPANDESCVATAKKTKRQDEDDQDDKDRQRKITHKKLF